MLHSIAIPLGVLGAIPQRPAARAFELIAFMADVMTGVPSIVMGLFIFTIWVLHFGYSGWPDRLACLLPIVIHVTYEMPAWKPDEPAAGQLRL